MLNLKTIVDNELKKRENIADGTSLWDKLPAHIQIYILQQKKISEEKAVNFMIEYEKELKKLQKKLYDAYDRYINYKNQYQETTAQQICSAKAESKAKARAHANMKRNKTLVEKILLSYEPLVMQYNDHFPNTPIEINIKF